MPTPKKAATIEQIREWSEQSQAQIFADYRGLTVREITNLRRKLRPAGAEFHIVKNTLYRRAWNNQVPEELEPILHGPTAVAFVIGDPSTSAKAVTEFMKEARKMELKGLLMKGIVYPADSIEGLAKLPPREVLISQVLGAIQSPISGLVGTLSEIIGQFVRTLQAVADQKATP
jgi:large subunit ribosomal protein L10